MKRKWIRRQPVACLYQAMRRFIDLNNQMQKEKKNKCSQYKIIQETVLNANCRDHMIDKKILTNYHEMKTKAYRKHL